MRRDLDVRTDGAVGRAVGPGEGVERGGARPAVPEAALAADWKVGVAESCVWSCTLISATALSVAMMWGVWRMSASSLVIIAFRRTPNAGMESPVPLGSVMLCPDEGPRTPSAKPWRTVGSVGAAMLVSGFSPP